MHTSLRRPVLFAALALALCGMASPALAVEPLDTFNVRVGGYVNRFDTDLRADGELRPGTHINLHQDLGLDQDNTLGYVAANWRPFERHEFGFSYYNGDASTTRKLQREIVFDDTVYQANSTVRSEYKLDAYELNYV